MESSRDRPTLVAVAVAVPVEVDDGDGDGEQDDGEHHPAPHLADRGGSSWAIWTPVCSVSGPTGSTFTPRDDSERDRRPAAPHPDGSAPCAPRQPSTFSRSLAASSRLSTLPAAETGIASMNTTSRSRLYGVTLSFTAAITDSAVRAAPASSALRTT